MFRHQLVLLLAITGTLSACAPEQDDINAFINHPGDFKGQADPLPVVNKYEPTKYNPLGLQIDPFMGHIKVVDGTTKVNDINAPDINRPKDVLEGYSLDALKVAGIVIKGKRTCALIVTPDGVTYTVTYGDRLGPDYGVVTGIGMNGDLVEVKIKETVSSSTSGTWEMRINSIIQQEATEAKDPAKG